MGKVSALLIGLLMTLTVAEVTVESYPIGSMDWNCDMVTTGGDKSGVNYQITAIACPEANTFEVYLSQWMTNTTLADIENDIVGRDDREYDSDAFFEPDEIRKITYTDMTDIVLVKATNYQIVADSLFVVYKNTTDNKYDNQYSIWMYRKDPASGWIDEQHITEFRVDGEINDVYLFEDYILLITDEESVSAVFTKSRDDKWDAVRTSTVFNEFKRSNQKIKKSVVFGDLYNKDWSYGVIYMVVESQGSVQLRPYNMNINTAEEYGDFTHRDDMDDVLYFPGTDITTLMITNTFIVVGVADGEARDGNSGYIQILQPTTLNELFKVEGRRGFKKVGRDASFNMNSDYAEQIWYTSQDDSGTLQTFNSILCFHNVKTEEWSFYAREEIFDIEEDVNMIYTTEYRNVFYMPNKLETSLQTFQSCPVNTLYTWKEDGPDKDVDYEDEEDWRLRKCQRCDFSAPFSYGFNADSCRTCEQVEPSIATADSYVQHFYGISCLGEEVEEVVEEVRPTDPEGNASPVTQIQDLNVTDPGEVVEEGDSTTIIIVGVILVVLVLAIFLFYNFYLKPRFYAQHAA
jgi:hypothetical protein